MTKAFLRKCWIALSSACLLGTVVTLACADDWGDEYGTSNFTPEIFVAKAYSPFFYSAQFYYAINHDEAQLTRWNQTNAADWAAWLGKKVPAQELNYLLDTADATIINEGAAWVDGRRNTLPQQLVKFRIFDTQNKKTAAFLHYLTLAKKAEAFSLTPPKTPWDDDSTKTKKAPFDAANLDKELQQGLTTATDPFLQERYWFQLIRSHFFNGTPDQTIRLFEDYRAKFPANKLWFRSEAYMAGAFYKRKEYSKANYYYSRIFDSCDELKTTAHYSFHPQEEADWNSTLSLCHNIEEKATLWQMLGIFYSDPNRAIGEIYRLDPHSEKLDLLLSRAVNAAEQGFDTKDDASRPSYNDLQADSLISHIADAGNTAKPWIWQLAAGYLAMLHQSYTKAAGYYKKADAATPHDRRPQEQLRLLKMLNTISASPTIDHALEEKLLVDLEWLISQQSTADIRLSTAMSWLKKTFAAKYKKTGDFVKAECFVHETAFYLNNKNVEALKAFLSKPNRSSYEENCVNLCTVKLADIYAYQTAMLTMADRIDEALTMVSHIPDITKDTVTLPGNPFNARINECHDCDHAAPQKIRYTQLSFLQKLKELKEKIAAGTDVYTNAVLLGNAQYNCTQFGNIRFYECKVLSFDDFSPAYVDSVFRGPLTDMTSAIKYYTLAAGAARADEQRAKCQYLLAKCQRNQWYMKNCEKAYGWDVLHPAFTAFDGFKGLKKYPNTNYYKEVIRECGYFASYIQKNP